MKLQPSRLVRLTLLAGLLCWFAPTPHAEVSIVTSAVNNRVDSLITSPATITEDADPIPQVQVRWQMYREFAADSAVNASGDDRQDGPPEVAYRHGSNWPVVAWAYNNGPDHDIALSEWAGNGWSGVQFLTSHTDDEIDPGLFVGNDGRVILVWWVDGAEPRVMLTSRSDGGVAWDIPVRVSPPGEIARRPAVAVFQGTVWVAYERQWNNESTASRELVLRRLASVDSFVEEHVIDVPRNARLDPELHVWDGRLWVDWKHSNTQFGSSAYVGAVWQTPRLYDWSDTSWVGVEGTRLLIRRNLFNAPDLGDVDP